MKKIAGRKVGRDLPGIPMYWLGLPPPNPPGIINLEIILNTFEPSPLAPIRILILWNIISIIYNMKFFKNIERETS
jgi:hypothetical protein